MTAVTYCDVSQRQIRNRDQSQYSNVVPLPDRCAAVHDVRHCRYLFEFQYCPRLHMAQQRERKLTPSRSPVICFIFSWIRTCTFDRMLKRFSNPSSTFMYSCESSICCGPSCKRGKAFAQFESRGGSCIPVLSCGPALLSRYGFETVNLTVCHRGFEELVPPRLPARAYRVGR